MGVTLFKEEDNGTHFPDSFSSKAFIALHLGSLNLCWVVFLFCFLGTDAVLMQLEAHAVMGKNQTCQCYVLVRAAPIQVVVVIK